MCEASAYLLVDGKEEILLEKIDKLVPVGEELQLENIFGLRKTIKAKIIEMALIDHKILLERK